MWLWRRLRLRVRFLRLRLLRSRLLRRHGRRRLLPAQCRKLLLSRMLALSGGCDCDLAVLNLLQQIEQQPGRQLKAFARQRDDMDVGGKPLDLL